MNKSSQKRPSWDDYFSAKTRPSWDNYFMKIAMLVAERSTCQRHHVGAVLVRDKRILTTGYNGAPAGQKDCLELGCQRAGIPSGEKQELCRGIHAEINAIIQAGLHGTNIKGATMYCTHPPCRVCAKALANASIRRYVTCGEYADTEFKDLFKNAGVAFVKIKRPETKIYILE